MIFVTVGTQLGFDRLVSAMDEWAAANPSTEVFIQIGAGAYRPLHCRFVEYTPQSQWEELFVAAERVVSHAGMGTILKSLDWGKPLIVMPRLAAQGEHRNDHQLATAKRFASFENVTVVSNAEELAAALDAPVPVLTPAQESTTNPRLAALLQEIRAFIHEEA